MIKGIPSLLSPDFLKILMEMGPSDELVIADANFPAASNASKLIRCDGTSAVDVLRAALQLFPLDTYTNCPAVLMAVVPGDDYQPDICVCFRQPSHRRALVLAV